MTGAPRISAPTARSHRSERLQFLRRRLAERGFVAVVDAAKELGVSEMTVRRDLDRLERMDLATRTHGGATAPATAAFDVEEPTFETRASRGATAKREIGECAARLPRPAETVGIDVGTTTLELARALTRSAGLKIFTNSLRAAMLLADSQHDVYISGGQVRAVEGAAFGPIGASQLRQFWLDHVFIGVSGITESGCFDYSLEETEMKRVFIEQAQNVVVLCDSSKFLRMSLVKVCDLRSVNVLVTDAAPPQPLQAALDAAGTSVVVANPTSTVARPAPPSSAR